MRVLFQDFFSSKALFFDLFDQAAKNVVQMASLLLSVVNTPDAAQREIFVKQIDKKENTGDDITHKIYLNLNRIIFTPISRDYIRELASTIDDVADTIKEASGRMYLYNIDDFTPPLKEIAELILNSSVEIERSIHLLRTSKKSEEVTELCKQVKKYERASDQVYYNAVAGLFETEKDAVNLIKYREILLSLETSVNKCKSVADTVNNILVNR
jgi:predicted phosphate transport protein (TIGR00153 family)